MGIFSGFEHIVRDQEPLAPYTWFRVGGPAQYFAEPTSVEELSALVRRSYENEMPVRVLGGGSNILARDEGVPGLIIHLAVRGQAPNDIKLRDSGGRARCLRGGLCGEQAA